MANHKNLPKRHDRRTLFMSIELTITTCMDCPNHKVIADPDPDDWFCDDDKAVVCSISIHENRDPKSRHLADRSEFRPIQVGIRPHHLRKETEPPVWCPLRKGA